MFEKQTQTIADSEAAIAQLNEQVAVTQAQLRGLASVVEGAGQRHAQAIEQRLSESLSALVDADDLRDPAHRAWNHQAFEQWKVMTTLQPGDVRVGGVREQRSDAPLPMSWNMPLIGEGRTIIIRSRGEQQFQQGLSLLQSIIVRTSAMLPQQVRYTLLDPAGNGLAFPMARHLQRVTPASGDVRRDLDAVVQEITRVISTYLDAATTSFDEIPDDMRLNEAFHFVCAADYPNRYDLRAAEALQNVAETGGRAGVFTIIHLNEDRWAESTSDLGQYLPSNAVVLDMGDSSVDVHGIACTLDFDEAPPADLQQLIFDRIQAAPPLDRPIPWDDLVDTSPGAMWKGSSDTKISATIGRHGANQPLDFWFGYDEREMRPCVHGVLGATAGAGKSTLLHGLINALAYDYSPDDLRFYLIDGKFGVEFRPYQQLPHAEVVSLRTSPELARSVLEELSNEMAMRNETFQRHGIVDLSGYRKLGSPDGPMPRILLIVDEFQQLFDGDKDNQASHLLKRISEQGRNAGLHMLLASQRFEASGMIDRDSIFNNIHMRVAMQLAQSEAASLIDFGPKGRRLISATCDRVGRLVMNDRVGDDEHNKPGKSAFLPSERRDAIVAELIEAAKSLDSKLLPDRVVFNGQAQPNLGDNPYLHALSDQALGSATEFEDFARRSRIDGGLDVTDWLAAERPIPMFIGQEFNVRGHALAVLRRRPNENLIIVGERHQERIAMLASALASAASANRPDDIRFIVLDRSVPRTDWSEVLSETVGALSSAGFDATCERDASDGDAAISALVDEIERRQGLSEDACVDEPSIVFMISEPDRIPDLQRIPDDYGSTDSELGLKLRRVAAQGPSVGVHITISSASLGVLRSVINDSAMHGDFRHRVTMQMSEDDSFAFVRSSRASTLQVDGERPVNAIQFDAQRQREVRFKPYSIAPPADEADRALHVPFSEQIRAVILAKTAAS